MTSRRKWARLSDEERKKLLSMSMAQLAEAHRQMGEAARRIEKAFRAFHGLGRVSPDAD